MRCADTTSRSERYFFKELARFLRIWMQTLLPPAITMALYFVIFGNLIGKRVGMMDGFSYVQYIAPGIIMMAVITNAYSNVVSSFFSAKFQRHVEEMLVAPVPNILILAGYVAGGVAPWINRGIRCDHCGAAIHKAHCAQSNRDHRRRYTNGDVVLDRRFD